MISRGRDVSETVLFFCFSSVSVFHRLRPALAKCGSKMGAIFASRLELVGNGAFNTERSVKNTAEGSAEGLRPKGIRAEGNPRPKGVRGTKGESEANDGEYFGKRRGGVLGQASGRRSLGKSFRGALLGQLSSSGAAPSSPTPLRGAVSSLYALFWAGGRQAPLPY